MSGLIPNDAIFADPETGRRWKVSDVAGLPGAYVPAGFGQFWRAKRNAAKLGNGLARLAVVGDSVTAGYYASNLETKSWFGLLRSALQAGYGDGGSGLKGVSDSAVVLTKDGRSTGVKNAWAAIPGNLVTTTGTWTEIVNGTDGPGGTVIQASTVAATAVFTVRGTSIEIFYQTTPSAPAAGSFTWQVDSGSVSAPVSSFHATQGTVEVITVPVSAGSHTVTITATDANGTLLFSLLGVSGRNASGVVADKYAHGGHPSTWMNNVNIAAWTTGSGSWGGSAQNQRGGTGAWCGGSSRPADLIVYALGLNDAGTSATAADTYLLNVRQYLEDVKSGGTQQGDTDIVLLMQHVGKIESTTTRLYTNYVARMRGLAETYGAALICPWTIGRNSWNYWSTLGYWGDLNTVGIAGTDVAHLSDAGHQAIADLLLPVLTA